MEHQKREEIKGRLRRMGNHVTVKILFVILIFVFPLNLLSIATAGRLREEVGEQVKLSVQNITDTYMNMLDFNMQKADNYLFEMLTKEEECIILKQQTGDYRYENAKYRCYMALKDQLKKDSGVDGYFFYMGKMGEGLLETAAGQEQEAIQEYLKTVSQVDSKWHLAVIQDVKYLLRLANEKEFYYGAFICLEDVGEEIAEGIRYDSAKVWFSEEEEEKPGKIQIQSVSQRGELFLNVWINSGEIFSTISGWNKWVLIIALLFLAVIPVLYLYLKRLVIWPLNQLNEAHRQMERGNRVYQITDQANSYEFQMAYDSFNQMMNNIWDLRVENMEKELEKKELELRNLQLQIRPHFLLNTFNMMYMLCQKNEVSSVKKLILYLADYFRYIFRSEKQLELFEKELKLIEGYIEAANMRYPDGLSIMYQIEPEIRMVRVPPLLIHNFIENVVNHALSHGSTVHIVLEAKYEDGIVEFQISDDGTGMEEEQVRQINENLWQDTKQNSHLGIRNAVMRLKHFYGEEAVLRVVSEKGNGTTFTITFPYDLEEEQE